MSQRDWEATWTAAALGCIFLALTLAALTGVLGFGALLCCADAPWYVRVFSAPASLALLATTVASVWGLYTAARQVVRGRW